MFEVQTQPGSRSGRLTAAPEPAEVLAFAESLSGRSDLDDAGRIDLIRSLEVLKCAAEGAQAVATADFDTSQREHAAARGVARERQGRGIAHQVALARRESPHKGQRHTGLAKILQREMPHTLAALRAGRITEWKATLLARETACLEVAHRRLIDSRLAGDLDRVEQMGDRELAGEARRLAAELDPASVAERRRKAESDRHVSIRPAPDTMTWLTAHLPVKQGVAVFATLKAEADRLVRAGDSRGRGQIMADTLVARVLGGFEACCARTSTTEAPPQVPVCVDVVISADSLVGTSDDAATVPGYGPIPAHTVREWIREGLAADVEVALRRLFADPETGQLVTMESRASAFPRPQSDFIEMRDQRCRTPWCDAPIRHTDHVTPRAAGGPTTAANGQGLCEACNYAKQAIGWDAHPRPGPAHEVETTTPTGHRYRSTAPSLIRTVYPIDLFWAA